MTNRGKLRRIGNLAREAVRRFGMRDASVHLYVFCTNPLFRVTCRTGERYMLRLAYPGWRTLEDLQAEAAWLRALSRDTDIGAPDVVAAPDGRAVLPMTGCGVPSTWNATLMTWVNGRLLAHFLTERNLEAFGALFGRLHIHGAAWDPPETFTTKRFDAFISRGEPDALFSESPVQKDDMAVLRLVRRRVEAEYAGLDPDDLRVIHCDLWHENVKLHHGRLHPFDFEDTIWGYRLHDMAMGMLDLLETVGPERYADLLAAFRAGYGRILDWPKGCMEVLQTGRMLWQLNHAARYDPAGFPGMIRRHVDVFRKFEETGKLLPRKQDE